MEDSKSYVVDSPGVTPVACAAAGTTATCEAEQPAKRGRRRNATIPADLIVAEQSQADESTPTALVRMAVQQGLDIDRLAKLLDLQQRWEAEQARKAFFAALSKFQAELPPICRADKVDAGRAGKRKYASLGTINEAIRPYLYANGLSFRFRQRQGPDGIAVTCIVSHRDGHSEETTLTAGADGSGGKNAIQSVGSTITYLERYTLTAALGLTTVDEDDDGEQTPPAATAHESRPAAAQPPASTPSAVGPQKPMIQPQQFAEFVSLAQFLWGQSGGDWKTKASEWLLEHAGTNDPRELTETEAMGVLSALNLLKHKMQTPTPPPPAVEPEQQVAPQTPPAATDGRVTQSQRDRIRELTNTLYAEQAGELQAGWLRSLGLGSAQSLTSQQAAERITFLESALSAGQQAPAADDPIPF